MLVATGGGCSALQGVNDYIQYNDACDDFVVGWRNYAWSNKAWHARKAQFACEPQVHDFGEGFRAGYRDVAAGSDGCPPPLPPRNYWSWKYQSPEGQAKIAAWFAGYPHGARAAEEDCAGNWREIPVSHVIEQQYAPEFGQAQIPRCDGSCFPQPPQGPMTNPSNGPQEVLPAPFGVPGDPRQPDMLPPPQGGSNPFDDAALRQVPPGFPPPMSNWGATVPAAYQAQSLSGGAWVADGQRSLQSQGALGGPPQHSPAAPSPDHRQVDGAAGPAPAGRYPGGR
jgi:hypothetical protein